MCTYFYIYVFVKKRIAINIALSYNKIFYKYNLLLLFRRTRGNSVAEAVMWKKELIFLDDYSLSTWINKIRKVNKEKENSFKIYTQKLITD